MPVIMFIELGMSVVVFNRCREPMRYFRQCHPQKSLHLVQIVLDCGYVDFDPLIHLHRFA